VQRFVRFVPALLVASLLAACGGSGGGNNATLPVSGVQSQSLQPMSSMSQAERGLWPRPGPAQRVCADASPGFAACRSWVRTDIASAVTPSGFAPKDLQTAYALTTASANNGSGVTLAIVDAYDDPNAESDLAVYRAKFGLPPCTTANGCFTKHAFTRRTNTGWAQEESLDIDMVSAICPKCHILLVEAASNSTTALTTAEDYATANANYVSNSWSGNEGSTGSDSHYQKAGKMIAAATGDSGFNAKAQWPAILPRVVGVGGTSLTSTAPRTESAWSGAGSGCSTIYAKPTFQTGLTTGCANRAQSDVSADADPNTGVAVYDTFRAPGWLVFGGTSVATPIIASVYALSGNTNDIAFLYAHASSLNDVTSGSNGSCGSQLCDAGAGWDGPTGEGSPKGLAAF
jgi:subtilase family serine protease